MRSWGQFCDVLEICPLLLSDFCLICPVSKCNIEWHRQTSIWKLPKWTSPIASVSNKRQTYWVWWMAVVEDTLHKVYALEEEVHGWWWGGEDMLLKCWYNWGGEGGGSAAYSTIHSHVEYENRDRHRWWLSPGCDLSWTHTVMLSPLTLRAVAQDRKVHIEKGVSCSSGKSLECRYYMDLLPVACWIEG